MRYIDKSQGSTVSGQILRNPFLVHYIMNILHVTNYVVTKLLRKRCYADTKAIKAQPRAYISAEKVEQVEYYLNTKVHVI